MPDPTEVLLAWANLLSAMVRTMHGEGVDNAAIHAFLDQLDLANLTTLDGDMLAFVLFVTHDLRSTVPSND